MKALKNIIITHLVMLGLFSGAALALAQNDPATTSPRAEAGARLEERQESLEERKTEIEAKRAEARVQLEARAQTRITNLAANLSNRMEAVLGRLQNITDRLSARISKLNENGFDTAEAAAALASAQLSIDSALAEISTIDTEVNNAVGSEDVRANWNNVKAKYKKIHDHILTARTELRASVAALKVAVTAGNTDNTETDVVDEALESTPE